MTTNPIIRNVLAGALWLTTLSTALGQGALTPSGAPAPSMKTLDQVYDKIGASGAGDARIDIQTVPMGGGGLHLITAPGSYYLSTNIVGWSGGVVAVKIQASNVSLDLNGFTLNGNGSSFCGIWLNAAVTNITIRNGSITGWGNSGIYADTGTAQCRFESLVLLSNIDCGIGGGTPIVNCVVADCLAAGNTTYGIVVGTGSQLERSQALDNGGGGFFSEGMYTTVTKCQSIGNGGVGINLGYGSGTVADCLAADNGSNGILVGYKASVINSSCEGNGSDGITATMNCSIRNCTSDNNVGVGINIYQDTEVIGCHVSANGGPGIYGDNGSLIKDCEASSNGDAGIKGVGRGSVVDCVARNNTGYGISMYAGTLVSRCVAQGNAGVGIGSGGDRCTVSDCTVDSNTGASSDGIRLVNDSVVRNCTVSNNGRYGIHTSGQNNRVDSNTATANTGYGIVAGTEKNLVIRNSAIGNNGGGDQFYVPVGNTWGAYVNMAGGGVITDNTGWENFLSYTP